MAVADADEVREQVREVIVAWLVGDGFQEGADGATQVARLVYGDEWTDTVIAEGEAAGEVRKAELRAAYLERQQEAER